MLKGMLKQSTGLRVSALHRYVRGQCRNEQVWLTCNSSVVRSTASSNARAALMRLWKGPSHVLAFTTSTPTQHCRGKPT